MRGAGVLICLATLVGARGVAAGEPTDDEVRGALAAGDATAAAQAFARGVATSGRVHAGLLEQVALAVVRSDLEHAVLDPRLPGKASTRQLLPALRALARREDLPGSAILATCRLARAGDPAARGRLRDHLSGAEPRLASAVAGELVELGDPGVLPWARRMALQTGPERAEAARALGRLGSTTGDLESLGESLRRRPSPGSDVAALILAMVELGRRSQPLRQPAREQLQALGDLPLAGDLARAGRLLLGDESVRPRVQQALDAPGPAWDLEYLAEACLEAERPRAVAALTRLAGAGATPSHSLAAAWALLERCPEEAPRVLTLARTVLSAEPLDRGDFLTDQPPRWLALLGACGTPADLPLVARFLGQGRAWRLQAAAAALELLARAVEEERTGPALPIRIEFAQAGYELTLAQAAAGVQLEARVVVERQIPGAKPESLCSAPDPGPSGAYPFADLLGGEQYFGLVDVGLGPRADGTPRALRPGTHTLTLRWEGRTWSGPSDTGRAQGPPFPPGEYRFRVRLAGRVLQDGREVPYAITASVPVRLLP